MATGNTLWAVVAAQAYAGPTSGFATPNTRAGVVNASVPCLEFPEASQADADFYFPCPSALTTGGGITVKIGTAAGTAVAGDAIFQLAINAFTDDTDDVDSAAFGTSAVITATCANASGEIVYDTVAFTSAAHGFVAKGEMVRLRISRITTGNTMSGIAQLYTVEVYET